jgi:hypothetical protein
MTNLSTDRNLWMMFFSVDGRTEIGQIGDEVRGPPAGAVPGLWRESFGHSHTKKN